MFYSEYAIKVSEVSKCYSIYNRPADRLKQSVLPRIRRVFGLSPQKYYREFWALRELTMDVRKGETIGIIGRNGSGKSTLLQLVCGTLNSTNGTIETKGRITALLELGSGFNPEFTGRENVFLNGAILGLSHDEIISRFDAIVDFADIGDFIEQPVKFYSSGMIVRLAFAVQSMVDPDILVVDEALAVGDELFQRKCFRRLEELKKKGTSILFVSHSNHQIIELCDQALLLDQGKRLLMADPVTTIKAYQKLLYSSPDIQQGLIRDLIELDQRNLIGEVVSKTELVDSLIVVQTNTESSIPEKEFFASDMIPQSTEIYPLQGAKVDVVKIFNEIDQEVNNLLPGKAYRFEVQGEFLEERDSVFLLFYIGRLSGPALVSLNYPGPNKYIDKVKAGTKFVLNQKIRMDLTQGIYFVTVSVNSIFEPLCMHKIVDAILFRILPNPKSWAFGYVDLLEGEPEFIILDCEEGNSKENE